MTPFQLSLPRTFVRAAVVAIATIVATPAVEARAREYSGIVVDARTGKTLYAHKADEHRYPASLTKMMTLYLTFEALEQGKITLKSRVRFSKYAAGRPPSKIGVGAGNSISVEQAIYALVTKSANDVATALAETLGGTESGFARKMTRKARALGMSRTTFRNASGLPNSGQKTTARDMARLGLALREHYPNRYKYFSTRSWRIGKARYGNHNKLLGRVRGVDGIKTGYIRASGYNLVSSVKTGGRSIVAVVIGGRTGASRNAQMQKLIARYLPKASRRGGGRIIAKSGGELEIAALPKSGPAAGARPELFAVPRAYASVEATARAGAREAVDAVTTASVQAKPAAPARTGWVIQVAATPNRAGADKMHSRARGKVASLRDREAFTQEIVKNGQTMHRVRFGGFSSKREAWAACKALKRRKMGCYALNAS